VKPSFTSVVLNMFKADGFCAGITSFSLFGGASYMLLISYLFGIRKESISASSISIVFMFLMFTWAWIGPLLLWYYENKLIPQFWKEAANIVGSDGDFQNLKKDFEGSLWENYWFVILIWAIFALYAFYCVLPFMKTFGLNGFFDKMSWPWFMFIGLLGIESGYGFAGIINTIRIINKISSLNLKLNQYHFDGHGGVLCVGNLAIKSLLLFCSGSIFIPILLDALTYQGIKSSLSVVMLVLIFILAITCGFFYPLRKFKTAIKKQKEIIFLSLKERISEKLKPECILGNCNANDQLQILNFRNACIDLDRIPNYPINTKILSEIIFYALLPSAMVILQIVATK